MLTEDNIIDIYVNEIWMKVCRKNAEKACVGGKSNFRHTKEERMSHLFEDQLTGQLGEYALSKYLFGNPSQYLLNRYVANRHPKDGDGGEDIIGLSVDVKTTKFRYPDKGLLGYNLAVRKEEVHKDWVYVSALYDVIKNETTTVHLIGWARTDELPEPVKSGPFRDCHMKPNKELHMLLPMRWMING